MVMTNKELMTSGQAFNLDDEELRNERTRVRTLLQKYNLTIASNFGDRERQLSGILGKLGKQCIIEQPFRCNYGSNIEIGDNFYAGWNLTILDSAKVHIGNNVKIGPNCNIYTEDFVQSTNEEAANKARALPISIGDNVYIGGNVTILQGVSIGNNCVIGAGSIVTKNIPANSVCHGVAAKVVISDENRDWQLAVDVIALALEGGLENISTNFIQRKFRIGYGHASRIISMLEDNHLISASERYKHKILAKNVRDVKPPKGTFVTYPNIIEPKKK